MTKRLQNGPTETSDFIYHNGTTMTPEEGGGGIMINIMTSVCIQRMAVVV